MLELTNNKFRSVYDFYQTMSSATDLFLDLPKLPKHLKNRKTYIKR